MRCSLAHLVVVAFFGVAEAGTCNDVCGVTADGRSKVCNGQASCEKHSQSSFEQHIHVYAREWLCCRLA